MFGTRYPIIQAPMGGITTPELVAAVSNAGGLGSLAAAYLNPIQITRDIARVRELTDKPFSVNLFTLDAGPLECDPRPMLRLLSAYHLELGLPPALLPERPAERFTEQAEAVLQARVPVFTFTFGIPEARWLDQFRAAGTILAGTATTAQESQLLEQAGVDAVIVQGAEAGAHRGTFAHPFEEAMVPTMTLVEESVRAVKVPVIAAGGIMDGRGIRKAMSRGAAAVQLGTAFIPCPECSAVPAYKQEILGLKHDPTVVTRAFSGRSARGIPNRFITEMEKQASSILPYPWQNAATRPLRNAAAKANRREFLSLWAGQNARYARQLPAGELIRVLAMEAGFADS